MYNSGKGHSLPKPHPGKGQSRKGACVIPPCWVGLGWAEGENTQAAKSLCCTWTLPLLFAFSIFYGLRKRASCKRVSCVGREDKLRGQGRVSCVCVFGCLGVCAGVHVHVCVWVCVYLRSCVFVCVCARMQMYACVPYRKQASASQPPG